MVFFFLFFFSFFSFFLSFFLSFLKPDLLIITSQLLVHTLWVKWVWKCLSLSAWNFGVTHFYNFSGEAKGCFFKYLYSICLWSLPCRLLCVYLCVCSESLKRICRIINEKMTSFWLTSKLTKIKSFSKFGVHLQAD